MKKVSKQEFKDTYFKYGAGRDGWSQSYWDQFFEPEPQTPMGYSIEAGKRIKSAPGKFPRGRVLLRLEA